MKYESNILKRLIDTYGVVGNPRYISEIIKEFIVQGKERFPNLFTYQADWLAHIDEFGLNPSYTVSYTGQSIYAPNTLERPVKNAILKGSTKYCDIDTGEFLETFEVGRNLELVSVKVPVLTTVGKNLFNGILLEQWSSTSGAISNNSKARIIKMKVKPNTTYVVTRTESGNRLDIIMFASEPMLGANTVVGTALNAGSNTTATPFTTTNDTSWIIIRAIDNIDNYTSSVDFQVEESSTATSYEPYKTNILSCLEPVELGSVGGVKDELNLLTQQLTQRTETRPYQEGDELNSEFVTDMTNTRYKLAQEVVNTVDLNILDQNGQNIKQLISFNGGTHFNTGSAEGTPLPVVSVSVETDLEETLRVCSLEGNTL